MICREAFKFSENSYGHWVPLMLTDPVQIVEGVADDLVHGYHTNIFAERGWNAEWKHYRANLVTKILIGTAIAGVAFALLRRKDDDFYEAKQMH